MTALPVLLSRTASTRRGDRSMETTGRGVAVSPISVMGLERAKDPTKTASHGRFRPC